MALTSKPAVSITNCQPYACVLATGGHGEYDNSQHYCDS